MSKKLFYLFISLCKCLLSFYFVTFTLCSTSFFWKVYKNFVKQKLKALNESKFKNEFEKSYMPIITIVELTTIVLPIVAFECALVFMFFCMHFILKIKKIFFKWKFNTIVMIIVNVRGGRNNKHENQLLITHGKKLNLIKMFLLW